jgi:hypothetical protein
VTGEEVRRGNMIVTSLFISDSEQEHRFLLNVSHVDVVMQGLRGIGGISEDGTIDDERGSWSSDGICILVHCIRCNAT